MLSREVGEIGKASKLCGFSQETTESLINKSDTSKSPSPLSIIIIILIIINVHYSKWRHNTHMPMDRQLTFLIPDAFSTPT